MRRFTKLSTVCLILFFVAACGFSTRGDLFRETLKQKGKKIAGQTLENSEWYMCRGASIGSIKDRYGVSKDKILAYYYICQTNPVGAVSVIQLPLDPS